MLPRVIVYNAVSLDGRIDWFTPDIEQFYGLAAHWQEDATLAGSETIVQAEQEAPGTSRQHLRRGGRLTTRARCW